MLSRCLRWVLRRRSSKVACVVVVQVRGCVGGVLVALLHPLGALGSTEREDQAVGEVVTLMVVVAVCFPAIVVLEILVLLPSRLGWLYGKL